VTAPTKFCPTLSLVMNSDGGAWVTEKDVGAHINVISFRLMKSMAFLMLLIMKRKNPQPHNIPYTEFFPNQTINMEITDVNYFISSYKMWLSLCQFSRNPQSLTQFLWTLSLPNFSKIKE
jgi:hypothetical protein